MTQANEYRQHVARGKAQGFKPLTWVQFMYISADVFIDNMFGQGAQ